MAFVLFFETYSKIFIYLFMISLISMLCFSKNVSILFIQDKEKISEYECGFERGEVSTRDLVVGVRRTKKNANVQATIIKKNVHNINSFINLVTCSGTRLRSSPFLLNYAFKRNFSQSSKKVTEELNEKLAEILKEIFERFKGEIEEGMQKDLERLKKEEGLNNLIEYEEKEIKKGFEELKGKQLEFLKQYIEIMLKELVEKLVRVQEKLIADEVTEKMNESREFIRKTITKGVEGVDSEDLEDKLNHFQILLLNKLIDKRVVEFVKLVEGNIKEKEEKTIKAHLEEIRKIFVDKIIKDRGLIIGLEDDELKTVEIIFAKLKQELFQDLKGILVKHTETELDSIKKQEVEKFKEIEKLGDFKEIEVIEIKKNFEKQKEYMIGLAAEDHGDYLQPKLWDEIRKQALHVMVERATKMKREIERLKKEKIKEGNYTEVDVLEVLKKKQVEKIISDESEKLREENKTFIFVADMSIPVDLKRVRDNMEKDLKETLDTLKKK